MRSGRELAAAGAITSAALVADRLTKRWAETALALRPGGVWEAWPGVFRWHYARNTGMAFSALSGKTGLLIAVSALLVLAVAACLLFMRKVTRPLCAGLSMVLAGGVGNLIDRVARGYVTDFIELTFLRFAVFNVADAFVCVGAALCAVAILAQGREGDARR